MKKLLAIYIVLIVFAAFIVLELFIAISISWTSKKGAPWAPTRKIKVHKMLTMAKVKPDDIVYDLGCGDGRVLVTAAKKYNAKAVGIEIDPFRFILCKFRIRLLGLRKQVKVIRGDFFEINLSDADIITCYLSQSTNEKLQRKLLDELQSHTIIVSNKFTFTKLNLISKDDDLKIYVYSLDSN
jgi:predicted RNA methylase